MIARTASDIASMRRVTSRHPRSSPTDDTFHRPAVSSANMTAHAPHRVLGIVWLLALALLLGANAWLVAGCLVPFLQPDRFEYLLLLQPIRSLFVAAYGSLLVLLAAHFVYARYARGIVDWRAALDWRSVRYLSPLPLLTLPLASLAWLATP